MSRKLEALIAGAYQGAGVASVVNVVRFHDILPARININPPSALNPVATLADIGGGGGITSLTSLDNSVVITNPAGPVPDLSVAACLAMFYGLTAGTGNGGPTDYAATIAVKTAAGTGRVPFPRSGPSFSSFVGGISAVAGNGFQVDVAGIYHVTARVHTTEPAQLEVEKNGAELPETCSPNMNPTAGGHEVVIDTYVICDVGDVLAIINPPGNAAALTITPADGSQTHANSQTLVIERVSQPPLS